MQQLHCHESDGNSTNHAKLSSDLPRVESHLEFVQVVAELRFEEVYLEVQEIARIPKDARNQGSYPLIPGRLR
jgi:hypothetical protein